jgi:hypothetical protein
MNVKEIVTKHLEANGFDGLFNGDIEDGCGCTLDDFMPCGGECVLDCEPGFRQVPKGPNPDARFIVGPNKPGAETPAAPPAPRPKIICLCGSSRFVAEMAVIAWEFEKDGHIVLGLHLLPTGYPTKCADHLAEAENVAAQMDALSLRKIDLADQVFVVNIGGYIGDSTAREIAYARAHGKDLRFLLSPELPAPAGPEAEA